MGRMGARLNLVCFAAIICAWVAWYIYQFGWSLGIQSLLVPILPLVYFNIYEPPLGKILYFFILLTFRILLFAYSLKHPPVTPPDHADTLMFQIVNSVVPLLILVIDFILFSSSIQASERELTINNQALHKEAGTDPLTGLPNRRALMDEIEQFLKNDPNRQFSVAIADIDFFKRVNDTYGHNCGDYTLKELSALFMKCAGDRYKVCRWGGEEFCFFLPGMNIDEAGREMNDLSIAVRQKKLRFGDIDYSITITIGVEENDFKSTLEQILDRADRKLYMGKVGGRDRVVV
jgi:diguanylate cyclase (GGDEF)-like protein